MQVGNHRHTSTMRSSARAHYALRLMTEVARNPAGPISLAEVSRKQGMPLPFLEQLAAALRKAGLITAVRGAHGGYLLARPGQSITALEIISAVEGEIAPVDCVSISYSPGSCPKEGDCGSQQLWKHVKQSIDAVLADATLDKLLQDQTIAAMATGAAWGEDDNPATPEEGYQWQAEQKATHSQEVARAQV